MLITLKRIVGRKSDPMILLWEGGDGHGRETVAGLPEGDRP
jgi:hypothetical protein